MGWVSKTSWGVLAVLVGALPARAENRGEGTGILVGLSREVPEDTRPSSLSTLLIGNEGHGFAVEAWLPGLVVPRKDGFWRVGEVSTCTRIEEGPVHAEYLWSRPLGERPTVHIESNERGRRCRVRNNPCAWNHQDLVFVWPDWVSVRMHGWIDCQRHEDWNDLATHPLDRIDQAVAMDERRTRFRRVLAPRLARRFRSLSERGLRAQEFSDDEFEDCLYEAPMVAWSAGRKQGGFALSAKQPETRNCIMEFDWRVPHALRPPFARGNGAPVKWKPLSRRVRDAKDAFEAPGGAWTLVVLGKRLVVREGPQASGSELLSVRLRKGYRVVMAEFTSRFQDWQKALAPLASEPLPSPRFKRDRE